ncbi:MAG: DUF6623 family protein [Desulfovermiculus sp.]|nr:DUF6623 family protein [Desulfovermiculus sp.]
MNILSFVKKIFLCSALACFFLGLAANSISAAEVISVHGHSGHIEYQDRLTSDRQFLGWGLQFDQSMGVRNWIHYSLPVPISCKVRLVGVLFQTGSNDVGISTIDVFNGSTRIYRDSELDLSGDKQWYVVDMGSKRTINEALGVSIEVGAGVESMSHQVRIYSVAALWEEF